MTYFKVEWMEQSFYKDVDIIMKDDERHPLQIIVNGYFPEQYSKFNHLAWFFAIPQEYDERDDVYYNARIACYNIPEFWIDLSSADICEVIKKRRVVSFNTGYFPGYTSYHKKSFILHCDEDSDDEDDTLPEVLKISIVNEPGFELQISLDSLRRAKIACMIFCMPQYYEKLMLDHSNCTCIVCMKPLFLHTHQDFLDCTCMFKRDDFMS